MNQHQLFRKTEERTFFAHHMLLHAAEIQIAAAEGGEANRFNNCLSALVLISLAVEALANAVGSRVTDDWPAFESLAPHEKVELLATKLSIARDPGKEPWTTLQYLHGFRNDIAHPKPDPVLESRVLPAVGLAKTAFNKPLSRLEREITVGNAKRAFKAITDLKCQLTDAMPESARFGIYVDMWHGSTTPE